MPFNGSGTFTVYTPGNPVNNGDTSNAAYFNNTMTDFATGLSNTMTRDGQGVPTANIPMGNNKLTGLANGAISTDAINLGQLQSATNSTQNGTPFYLTSVSGTNTITASLSGLTAYTAGLTVRFTASGANTGAVTLNIASLGAIALVRADGVALATGDILSAGTYEAIYDGTSFKLQGSVSASQLISSQKQIQPVTASIASNALTVGLNATSLDFRSTTLTTGVATSVSVPSPISLTVPANATLGTTSALFSRIVTVALNNAGTVELAVVNITGSNDLSETGLISTTAISSGSTSANVFYSTTARTSVAYRVVGFVDSTQTTAGTWAQTPTLVQGLGGNSLAVIKNLGIIQNTTSGTSVDFIGIPAGVRRVSFNLSSVSTTGTGDLLVQGGSGSIETTGYNAIVVALAGSVVTTTSVAIRIASGVTAATNQSGRVTLEHLGSNRWTFTNTLSRNDGVVFLGSGDKVFSGTLDRIRLTTVGGTDTFDLGVGSVSWEF